MVVIAGSERLLGVAEYAAKFAVGGGTQHFVYFGLSDRFVQLHREVNGGNIDGGHAHGLGFELVCQVRQDTLDTTGEAGINGNNRGDRGARLAQVGVVMTSPGECSSNANSGCQ